ncbi:hypothetical protein ACT3CE_14710 [Marinifilum sp. RC60d5]|uniref:hypothetical protein n=1 Tax=Marinifilum sp. RC60d5 TaxID=3458414 RepID=UPI0040352423
MKKWLNQMLFKRGGFMEVIEVPIASLLFTSPGYLFCSSQKKKCRSLHKNPEILSFFIGMNLVDFFAT